MNDEGPAPDGSNNWGGMGPEGQERINDTSVGSATGTDYERQDLNSAPERRAVPAEVEKSVAQGHPVPVDVSGEEGAHVMTIIAQEGDTLQVYKPLGLDRLGQRGRLHQRPHGQGFQQ